MKKLATESLRKRGRPSANDKASQKIQQARKEAKEIKSSAFTIGKAPENLTDKQKVRLALIQANDSQLYRAYQLKKSLRQLLKMPDVEQAEKELNHWLG